MEEKMEVDDPASLYVVFGVIAALTFLTLALSFYPLGVWNLVLQLTISLASVTVLGRSFMHLKKADTVTWLTIGAMVFWMMILFVLVLSDFVTREHGSY